MKASPVERNLRRRLLACEILSSPSGEVKQLKIDMRNRTVLDSGQIKRGGWFSAALAALGLSGIFVLQALRTPDSNTSQLMGRNASRIVAESLAASRWVGSSATVLDESGSAWAIIAAQTLYDDYLSAAGVRAPVLEVVDQSGETEVCSTEGRWCRRVSDVVDPPSGIRSFSIDGESTVDRIRSIEHRIDECADVAGFIHVSLGEPETVIVILQVSSSCLAPVVIYYSSLALTVPDGVLSLGAPEEELSVSFDSYSIIAAGIPRSPAVALAGDIGLTISFQVGDAAQQQVSIRSKGFGPSRVN